MSSPAGTPGALPPNSSIGPFVLAELVSSAAHEQVYQASEARLERTVLVRVAAADAATAFAADARRVAAVAHPHVVPVLAAGTFEGGAYAAAPDLAAHVLRERIAAAPLTTAEAVQIVRGVAAASDALAAANIRVPIDLDTVLVASGADGERGLLDPLRAIPSGGSRLGEADVRGSTRELAELLDSIVKDPDAAVRRAIADARSGGFTRPKQLIDALGSIAAPARPRKRHRRLPVIAATVTALAAIAIVVAIIATRDEKPALPAASPPAATVVAHIPLGLSGKEEATAFAIHGQRIWVTTNQGRLLRVDTGSNEVVGSPIVLDARKSFLSGVVSSSGSLWVTSTSLLRLDPDTGRVLKTLDVSGKQDPGFVPVTVLAGDGILWIPGQTQASTNPFGTGGVLRFDPVKERPIGRSSDTELLPFVSAAGGGVAFVQGLASGVVTRFDASTGKGTSLFVDPAPGGMAVSGDTVWIADAAESILTRVDAKTMRFSREAIPTRGFAINVAADGPDIWVTTSKGQRGTGTQSLERFDARSGRRAGRPVQIATTREVAIRVGLGSVWTLTTDALTRLSPSTPRPALAPPPRMPASPRPLRTGPLAGGRWKAAAFVAPFTLSVPSFGWVAETPTSDSASLVEGANAANSISVLAPERAYVTPTRLAAVGSPSRLLTLLHKNAHLRVGDAHPTTVSGHAAIRFMLTVKNPPVNFGACGPTPCVPLFPLQGGGLYLLAGTAGPATVFKTGGRTIVILQGAKTGDQDGLAHSAAIVRTFAFARA